MFSGCNFDEVLQHITAVGVRCATFTADHSTPKIDYSRPLEKRGSRFTAEHSRGVSRVSGDYATVESSYYRGFTTQRGGLKQAMWAVLGVSCIARQEAV